jgi:hypothetical protein
MAIVTIAIVVTVTNIAVRNGFVNGANRALQAN